MATSLDDLVSLAIFARVVECKSFTGAAAALGVSKSIVSKRVSALEESLGARLLHRTTRRLSLTSEGARLYERCLSMLRAADEAPELVRGTSDEPRGVLRVTSPFIFSDAYLADAIVSFVVRYPKVHVELEANNAMVDLVDERVDDPQDRVRVSRLPAAAWHPTHTRRSALARVLALLAIAG